MMGEYIRKKDAIKSVAKHMRDAAEFDHPYAARRISEWKPLAESYLRNAQTVDAVERKKGKWRVVSRQADSFTAYRCSECNELVYGRTNFCHNCGADMRGGYSDEKCMDV